MNSRGPWSCGARRSAGLVALDRQLPGAVAGPGRRGRAGQRDPQGALAGHEASSARRPRRARRRRGTSAARSRSRRAWPRTRGRSPTDRLGDRLTDGLDQDLVDPGLRPALLALELRDPRTQIGKLLRLQAAGRTIASSSPATSPATRDLAGGGGRSNSCSRRARTSGSKLGCCCTSCPPSTLGRQASSLAGGSGSGRARRQSIIRLASPTISRSRTWSASSGAASEPAQAPPRGRAWSLGHIGAGR